jgi:hypothetical protein
MSEKVVINHTGLDIEANGKIINTRSLKEVVKVLVENYNKLVYGFVRVRDEEDQLVLLLLATTLPAGNVYLYKGGKFVNFKQISEDEK